MEFQTKSAIISRRSGSVGETAFVSRATTTDDHDMLSKSHPPPRIAWTTWIDHLWPQHNTCSDQWSSTAARPSENVPPLEAHPIPGRVTFLTSLSPDPRRHRTHGPPNTKPKIQQHSTEASPLQDITYSPIWNHQNRIFLDDQPRNFKLAIMTTSSQEPPPTARTRHLTPLPLPVISWWDITVDLTILKPLQAPHQQPSCLLLLAIRQTK